MTKQPITILITGRNGQLGSELQDLAAQYLNTHFVNLSKEQLSITDKNAVYNCFQKYKPQYFINCAAYTAVDKAEEEQDVAFAINAEAPGYIASMCTNYNCKLVHISTDYVFDGSGSDPLSEDHTVNPINLYGASKLEGERLVAQNNPDSIILRTSWVYSAYGKNFVKTMMRLLHEKDNINVVSDQVGSPTYAADLAQVILQIIHSGDWLRGIYHYSNEGVISWYDFALAIKELTGAGCSVRPISTDQYPTPAKRPLWSVMSKEKIKQDYKIEIPYWKDSLKRCVSLINKEFLK
jgi:dTDP-4-dehydrorhamnose reductase